MHFLLAILLTRIGASRKGPHPEQLSARHTPVLELAAAEALDFGPIVGRDINLELRWVRLRLI